jgi:hypothetical protein
MSRIISVPFYIFYIPVKMGSMLLKTIQSKSIIQKDLTGTNLLRHLGPLILVMF